MVVPLVWSCRLYGGMVGIWFICGSLSSQAVVPLMGCSGVGGVWWWSEVGVWWWGVGGVW